MLWSALLVATSLVSYAIADDLDTIYQRQVDFILRTTTPSASKIKGYVSSLRSDGSWSAINYGHGCDAQRSSWPAGGHWSRILDMAAAYRGAVPEYKDDSNLRSAIRNAMGYWFNNDYSTIGDGSCMDRDFLPNNNCPCGTPGFWGPNWYSNVIQVPTRSGKACTLLRSDLTDSELANCTLIASRAYAPFYRDPQPGYVSGANIIDMAVIGISAGLLENNAKGNASRIADAYGRVHGQVIIQDQDGVDGIKPDGSFQQHIGVLYDGNYGKDFSNSLLELELQARETQFQADKVVQDVFGHHLNGARWMTYTNVSTGIVHWDLTVIGRFITYPVSDDRASADLRMDLDQVSTLGHSWNQQDLIKFASELTGKGDNTANSGSLLGNRMFWNSDYMVHRTDTTITTVKMLSTRTKTSECINSENPYGFHLSDGVVYTYSTGAEYEDMFATMDWNIPPGITTEYGALRLDCSNAAQRGVDDYAGGVQAGDVGIAAMRYVNPSNQDSGFFKAWIFFPDNVQHVLVSNVRHSSDAVFSVLDQRIRSGDVYVNSQVVQGSGNISDAGRLWHAGTGYVFPPEQAHTTALSLSLETKTGDWRQISLSPAPPSTKDMFAAWIAHRSDGSGAGHNSGSGIEYSVFPATRSDAEFVQKSSRMKPRTLVSSRVVSAAMDARATILAAAFWTSDGGFVDAPEMGIRIEVDRGVVLILQFEDEYRSRGTVSIAEPSHATGRANVKISSIRKSSPAVVPGHVQVGTRRGHRIRDRERCVGRNCSDAPVRRAVGINAGPGDVVLGFDLPEGGMAGSTVTMQFERQ
ncbi:hypothetical protein CTheo_8008 [Ceratobasidium theobromae]|uniref:Polysaccharide lyase family 8 protein n=1 Tax=Ceratobasidium theobromae TaxID=1582974 RepID=A0A5N5Q9T6_9AGAM|nr:hypothetical protein CTheo_8008 [Ceratobasidium theobromae]